MRIKHKIFTDLIQPKNALINWGVFLIGLGGNGGGSYAALNG
jgi:hypothetical protein